MLSGLDLLKGTNAQPAKTGLDLLKGIAPVEGDAQVKTGLDLLKRPVITEVPITAAPIMSDVHPATKYIEKFTKPPIEEYDKYQMGPLITEESKGALMDTLGRLWNLAQHPYDVVKGTAMFASEIPGFIGGLASAVGQVPIEILKGGTVLDWYNASAQNMQTISGLWHRGVTEPFGKLLETPEKMGEELALTIFGAEPEVRKDEAELIGEIFMVPYTAVTTPLHELADSPTWVDYPNVRGLLKFSADALGLVTMGLALKGGPVMAARKVDPIVKKAHDIETRQTVINVSDLNETIKAAQNKILEAEKVQLELEIESLKKDIDTEKSAKENLKEKGKEVEEIKEGIEVEAEAIREERLKFAEEAAKEIPEEKVKTGIKLIKKMPPKPPEPVIDLDYQTGLKEPPGLSTENSPFRETPERTQEMKDLYAEKAEAVRSNPELLTNKLLNDVNRWLDGEELPIERAKNDLSELAARAEELERLFISPSDFLRWKDTVSDAATWARKVDRAKIERTITEPDISIELKQLHEHRARILGFEKAGGSFVEGYLKELAKVAEKTDMDAAMAVYGILGEYRKGNIEQAALKAEKILGKLHKAEKDRLKIERPEGPTLYTGLPLDEAVKQLKEMAKHTAEFMKEFRGSFKEKEFDFAHAVKQVKADTVRALWDQSETLLNMVKNKYPQEYERIATRQRSAVTGIGYGKVLYGQAVKEIYGGKTKEMTEAINAYVLARRFKDIYGYRAEKGYKRQPGYGPAQTTSTSAMIEMIKDIPPDVWGELSAKVPGIKELFGKLTPSEMADVVKAGEAYFEWSRKIVDDLVGAGIKSHEEGVLLKSHDFRKFKTMSIKKLYDFNYTLQLRGETIKVSNSGVLELGAGSTKIIEPDSRVVLSEQMARAYGSIAHQAAALEWKGLADRHPDNGFVSTKRQAGWGPIPYVADGVRKNIYFHPDVIKYLVTRSRDISPRLAMVIRNLTMAPVTRSLAVGLSPIWSTFAGLPMDVMHSLWAARTWEVGAKGTKPRAKYPFYETREGKFKKVYSPFAGVDALQIGLDMKRTLGDVYSRGPLTTNLMKHGLVMNFLTQRQNRYMKGVKPPGDWAKMMDLLSYHGLSMELWTRVATADRVIRRDAKKLGITYGQALKNNDIMYRAAHAGRDRMDYNQGGWFVKALDQSGMIFLNAAVLGTRTFWRQAVDNPVDFAFKTAQIGTAAAGITAAAWSLYPETMKDMSDKVNRRDVTWPIAPNWLRVKDNDGDDVSFYFKLRMDPNAAFMYRIFEGLTRTYMYDQGLIKEEPDYRELTKSLKQLGPVDVKLPPGIQAWVDYTTNYSWWKDRQMYTQMGGRTLDWPKSQYEGLFDEDIPQMAKDIAEVTKVSPTRLAGAISNIIPRNNEFVWLTGSAYEQAFSDLPEEVRRQHWLITLAETPGFNKVIGMTRHGRGRWKVKSDIENEVELERMVRNGKFDMLATQNAWYGVKNQKELSEFMKEQDFDVYKDMTDTFKFIKDPIVKTLPHRDFWLSMKHSSIEGRAKTWVELLERSSEAEKKQLINELSQVMIVGGVVTPEFMEEVGRLKSP